MSILLSVFLLVLASYVFGYVAKRIGIPVVVGQVIGGIFIAGTSLRPLVFAAANVQVVDFLASVGAVLLFFFVGLEINTSNARKNLSESIYVSVFNTGVPLASGFAFAHYVLSLDFVSSLVVGISLCVSSIAVSLEVLEEMRLLKSRLGSLVVLAGTVGDILQSVAITLLLAIFQISVSTPGVASVAGGIVVFLLVILALKQWVIPFVLDRFESDKSTSGLLGGALLITLFVAIVSESLGFSSLVGALVAGILTRSTILSSATGSPWKEHTLAHQVHSLAFGFFVPIFFTRIGLEVSVGVLSTSLPQILVLFLVAGTSMVAGTVIGVMLSGSRFSEGFVVGLGLLAKGDVDLVILSLALANGLITGVLYSQLVAMGLALTLAGPLLFKHFAVNSRFVRPAGVRQVYKRRKA